RSREDQRETRLLLPGIHRRAFGEDAPDAAWADDRPDLALEGLWPGRHRLDPRPHLLAPGPVRAHPVGPRQRRGPRRSGGHQGLEDVLLAAVAGVPEEEAREAVMVGPGTTGLPLNFALGVIEGGHEPEIFLAGEVAYAMSEVPLQHAPVDGEGSTAEDDQGAG